MTIIISQASLTLAILFLSTRHPLSLGFILIVTSVVFSILIFLSSRTAWISYIVMIVFLRGSIVIFIYITSISSNEAIYFDFKYILLRIIINIILLLTNKIYLFNYNTKNLNSLNPLNNSNSLEIIYKTYRNSLNFLTIFIIIYLLLIIIVAVKISIIVKSPVRST